MFNTDIQEKNLTLNTIRLGHTVSVRNSTFSETGFALFTAAILRLSATRHRDQAAVDTANIVKMRKNKN
jgi:hypothetical protein